jgi:hypothetical protein
VAAPTAADCASVERVDTVWLEAVGHLDRGDLKAANDLIEPWNDACPKMPLTASRVLAAAVVAQRRGDAEAIVDYLTRLPELGADLGSRPGWMLLLAYQKLKDEKGFAAQRAKLLAAVDRALSDPAGAAKGRRIERFDVGRYHFAAYEAQVEQGLFVRTTEFIISTDDPLDPPTSILITRNMAAEQMTTEGPKPLFVDRYTCGEHATLTIVPAPLTYEKARTRVTAFLSGDQTEISRQTPTQTGCAWPSYITPGLDPPLRPRG